MEDNRPVSYAKLDIYDYDFRYNNGKIDLVLINVGSNHDVDIADIASEITSSDGNIYVEGNYLKFKSITTKVINGDTMAVISVVEN